MVKILVIVTIPSLNYRVVPIIIILSNHDNSYHRDHYKNVLEVKETAESCFAQNKEL